MQQQDPGHERATLNAYERHQLELIERQLSREEQARPDTDGSTWLASRWLAAVVPWVTAATGIWLVAAGSALGVVFALLAAACGLTFWIFRREQR